MPRGLILDGANSHTTTCDRCGFKTTQCTSKMCKNVMMIHRRASHKDLVGAKIENSDIDIYRYAGKIKSVVSVTDTSQITNKTD